MWNLFAASHSEREGVDSLLLSSKIWKNGTRLPYWISEFKTKSVPSRIGIFVFSWISKFNLKFSKQLPFLSLGLNGIVTNRQPQGWELEGNNITRVRDFHLISLQSGRCIAGTFAVSMVIKLLISDSLGWRRAHWFFTRVLHESSYRYLKTVAEPFNNTDKTILTIKIMFR